ncbi:hypothetical protein EQ829_25910 [Ectopseudomonas mendocina]|nr:hypothetical protein EQ829_25910 [Pseudomonas mendocina]
MVHFPRIIVLSLPLALFLPSLFARCSTPHRHGSNSASVHHQYLTADTRPQAAVIRQVLLGMRDASLAGTPRAQVEAEGAARLQAAGFQVDYAVVRLPDLGEPGEDAGARVALVAARLGSTRLIDNIEF